MDIRESIKEVLSSVSATQGMHVKTIADKLVILGEMQDISPEEILSKVQYFLNKTSKTKDSLFVKVKNDKGGFKKGVYKLKPITTKRPPIKAPVEELLLPNLQQEAKKPSQNLYTGKAGECAVMSELLF